MARVPAAGNGRSRGPRGGDKPGARTGQAAPRVSNASTSDTASARADKAPSSAGTPRRPRPGQRAAARGRRGGAGGRGGASGRRIDPARLVAFDVLRAVRERDAYANLLLLNLLREREWLYAGGNVILSVVLCMIAVWLGWLLGATFSSMKGN